MKIRLAIFSAHAVLGAALTLTACASPPISATEDFTPAAPSFTSSPKADRAEYTEIHQLYVTQSYEQALLKMRDFEKRYPNSVLISDVENLRGLCLLLTQRSEQAVERFKSAISKNVSGPAVIPFLNYNLARAQFEAGDYAAAEQTAALIQPEMLNADNRRKFSVLKVQIDNKRQAVAAQALQKLQEETPVDPKAIGVLLPLKGRFSRFGQRNLQAIEQAFHIFDAGMPDRGYSLVIQDSGEDPEQAIKGLNELVTRHHVAAVIGPLLSKGIDQVSHRAQELGVPLFSLARHVGGSEEYVIQSGLTLQTQAYEMARYAIENRGLRKFAILHAKDKVGEEAARYFWNAVESLGGQIVGIEAYTPNETDFRQYVDKLSGLYYTEARQSELDELAKQRKLNQIKRKTRKTEQYFNLPPIVDYQAVYIPDEPKVTGQIMPTFAYRDVDHVQFLGTSAWSSPELVDRAQNYAEGALFVDAFFSGSQSPQTRKFIDEYKSQFGADPSGMDALAYDAAIVLQSALDEAGSSFSRRELLERIRGIHGVNGVTGHLTYKDGQLARDLRVLSIQAGQIVEQSR